VEPKPSDSNTLSIVLAVIGVGGIGCVVVIYLVTNKRKKG